MKIGQRLIPAKGGQAPQAEANLPLFNIDGSPHGWIQGQRPPDIAFGNLVMARRSRDHRK
ncbi:MAG: hypothetical protein WC632_02340 [Candidatus Margulisiibacteriota bacterium]